MSCMEKKGPTNIALNGQEINRRKTRRITFGLHRSLSNPCIWTYFIKTKYSEANP